MINYIDYTSQFFKFKVPEIIHEFLHKEDLFYLTEIGLPQRVLSNKFKLLETVTFDEQHNCLILGSNTHIEDWKLKLDINQRNIFYSSANNEILCFYNTSISKLLLCNFSYEFFIRRLIKAESFGAYYDNSSTGGNFEKYANVLKELIIGIDETAAKEGAWHSLIEEMSMGVI
jgi:hypothetical protein